MDSRMIKALYKITSENGQTHNGSHIYTHDRHCRATLAMREDGQLRGLGRTQWSGRTQTGKPGDEASQVVLERVCSMPTSEKGTTKTCPQCVRFWRFHCNS